MTIANVHSRPSKLLELKFKFRRLRRTRCNIVVDPVISEKFWYRRRVECISQTLDVSFSLLCETVGGSVGGGAGRFPSLFLTG
jgi:hypothetical protein